MNFISYSILFGFISVSLSVQATSVAQPTIPKTPLEICADSKLKILRVRTLVTLEEEPMYLSKFKKECVKEGKVKISQQETLSLQAEEAALNAQKEKEEKNKKTVVVAAKPASLDSTVATGQTKPAVLSATPASASYTGPVFGGCGTQEQCAAVMREANTPKYTWSSPGLQAYLGELWGNNFNYAHSLGGTYEQPDSICTEKNQGELIAFDMGTEVRPVACMSSFATQEEIKAMAAKIKTVKVETLPTVIAVKRPQYECKKTKEPDKLEEGQMRICNGGCSCGSENIGAVWSGGPGCGEAKCIRIDGGPVKPKTAKKDEKPKEKDVVYQPLPVEVRQPAATEVVPTTAPASAPAPVYQGYDRERDGAAGP
ncbi:MAG: hypothetical protein ABL930_12775 [Pseudobdellovibrio sp.]